MDKPILSICIPTRNREKYLYKTLLSLTSEEIFLNTNKIEIVISDNCSTDSTSDVCNDFMQKFPDKVRYIRQKEDLHDKNFIEVIKLAKGKYAKLNNDTITYKPEALEFLVNSAEKAEESVLFLSNRKLEGKTLFLSKHYKTFDELLYDITYLSTWIASICVKTEEFKFINNPTRFSHLNFAQTDIIARMIDTKKTGALLIDGLTMNCQNIKNKGGYNICEVFGNNFFTILQSLIKENFVSQKTYNFVLKEMLFKHINLFHFDLKKQFTFKKGGYFKYLFKYYYNKPYFYLNYIHICLNKILNFIYRKEKNENYKTKILFNIIKIKFKCPRRTEIWRSINQHNMTNIIEDTRRYKDIIVGKGTYGDINASIHGVGDEKLIIGNYCSIAPGVRFIVSSDHSYKGLSTYPFKVWNLDYDWEAKSKGSIIVNDDVWICANAIILSGVTIGQGAIIGAGAVVTKNVPPYAIVVGNPAKIIKYRFEPEIIEKLLTFDFSKLTEERIKKIGTKLYKEITKENVDELLKEFSNNV